MMVSINCARQHFQWTRRQFLLVFILLVVPWFLYYFGPPIVPNVRPESVLLSAVLQFQDTRGGQVENIAAITKTLNATGHGKMVVHPVCPGYRMTIFDGGRLGNKMGEYATLWAYSKRLGYEPIVTPGMKSKFNKVFKSATIKSDTVISRKPLTVEKLAKEISCKNLPKSVKIDWSPVNGNPLELESFHPYREDIKRELAFKDEIVQKAELFLDNVRQKNLHKRMTFVSIHVRGHEYNGWLASPKRDGRPVTKNFFLSAMDYFKKLLPAEEIIFIVGSDDYEFCFKTFIYEMRLDNVIMANQTTQAIRDPDFLPEFDMAVLQRCDHHIITYGSYGFWSAYLGKNEDSHVVVADGYYKQWTSGTGVYPVTWAKILNWTLLWDTENEVNKNATMS